MAGAASLSIRSAPRSDPVFAGAGKGGNQPPPTKNSRGKTGRGRSGRGLSGDNGMGARRPEFRPGIWRRVPAPPEAGLSRLSSLLWLPTALSQACAAGWTTPPCLRPLAGLTRERQALIIAGGVAPTQANRRLLAGQPPREKEAAKLVDKLLAGGSAPSGGDDSAHSKRPDLAVLGAGAITACPPPGTSCWLLGGQCAMAGHAGALLASSAPAHPG